MIETAGDEEGDRGRLALGRRLIANALQYSPAPIAQTAFLKNLRHDKHLLPLAQQQLRTLLDGFHRDSTATYDIQGFSDNGCDLLVRLEGAKESSFIGLQVKSHVELTEKGIADKLVLQYSSALDYYSPLDMFYIFLAADLTESRKHQAAVRRIQQTFSKKPKVRVVDPLYAATFLRLPSSAMDSLTVQTMRTGDPVLSAAKLSVSRHPLSAALIILMVVRLVEGRPEVAIDELLCDRWLQAVCETVPEPWLEETGEARECDSWPLDEDVVRLFLGLTPSGKASTAIADESGFPLYSDDYLTSSWPTDILRNFLLAETPSSDAASRLFRVLPRAVDSLDLDEFEWVDPDSTRLRLKADEHAALLCLASEGRARHQLAGSHLVDYLVRLVLSDDS